MDRLTKEQRYKNMSANKGKGTKLELLFGKLLWNVGLSGAKRDAIFEYLKEVLPQNKTHEPEKVYLRYFENNLFGRFIFCGYICGMKKFNYICD